MRKIGLALLLLVGLALTGCGSGDGTGSNGSNGSPGATNEDVQQSGIKFAQCMRDNGVPMKDPDVSNGEIQMDLPEGVSREKAEAAEEACKKFLPNGGQPTKRDPKELEAMRKMAQCMRENGVPDFPDPDESGQRRTDQRNQQQSQMDPNDPKVKAAEQACATFRPSGAGAPTLNNNGGEPK